MAGALILADQPTGAGPGVAGKARNDMWRDRAVNLSCPEPGNTSHHWYLLGKPLASATVMNTPENPTANFTMDRAGTYRVRLITNGGGPGNTQTRVYRCRYDNVGNLLERGWALPAVDEEPGDANYDTNERHWSEPLETILEDVRLNAFSSASTVITPTVTSASSTPLVVGACLVTEASAQVRFRVIMATADATLGSAAFMDLYDLHGVLSGGTPGVVAGSQIDTTTGVPPVGSPAADPLILSAYEVDLTAAFASLGSPGVFELRLWSEDNATPVTMASASLVWGA